MTAGPTIGHLVWRLSMKWRTAVDSAVAPVGLTHAKYVVLSSLREITAQGVEPSQRALAEHTGLEPVYISKIASGLERDGLIERRVDAHDTRVFRLALTRPGAVVIDQAIAVVRSLIDGLTEPLGGSGSKRTAGLARELEQLLANPIAGQHEIRQREKS